MSIKAKTLVKGSVFRSCYFFINIVATLLLMPFIIRCLGDRMYGLWIVIGSFMGFYWLFDFGLSSAVQRYVSRAIGANDRVEENEVINTAFFIFMGIGFLALLVSVFISFFSHLFMKTPQEIIILRKIIIILGLSFAVGFPMKVFCGVINAHLRYDLSVYTEVIKLFFRVGLVLLFLSFGGGILTLAFITFVVEFVGYILYFVFAKKIAPYIKISRRYINSKKIKPFFSYSITSFISQIADKLRFNVDSFVIAAFLGLNLVTVYSIAARLVKYFVNFIMQVVGMMSPVFSQYEATNNYVAIKEKFIFLTKISAYIAIFIGGTLIIFGEVFIERWIGREYLDAYPLLVILVIPVTFALMQSQSVQLLYGISKHKFYAISNSIEGVVNLILSLILVQKFGLLGVALGTAIPMMIIKLFIQPIYTCKVIKLDIHEYYLKIMLPVVLKSLSILVIFWYLSRGFIMPNYFSLTVMILCEVILFCIVIFFIGFNSLEGKHFRNLFSRRYSKARVQI